jgi:hypothetical protein
MKTLKELFDEHGYCKLLYLYEEGYIPKMVKISAHDSFKKIFYVESVDEYGDDYEIFNCDYDSKKFKLFQEPKQKVKRYQYAYQRKAARDGVEWANPEVTNGLYKDDTEFLKAIYDSTDLKMFKRLDNTMQEFDE